MFVSRPGFAGGKWIMKLATVPYERLVPVPRQWVSNKCLQLTLVSKLLTAFSLSRRMRSVGFISNSRHMPPSLFCMAIIITPGPITEKLIFNHYLLRVIQC